jgi:hypothetical protein
VTNGSIPDVRFAVGGPVRISASSTHVARLLDVLREVPSLTWGRVDLRTGEMWNSNALVAWALARSGLDLSKIMPPPGGRAPGWSAGVVLARRQDADGVGSLNVTSTETGTTTSTIPSETVKE